MEEREEAALLDDIAVCHHIDGEASRASHRLASIAECVISWARPSSPSHTRVDRSNLKCSIHRLPDF